MTPPLLRVALCALLAPAPACFHPTYGPMEVCGPDGECPDGLPCIDKVCGGSQGPAIPDAMVTPTSDAATGCDVTDPSIRLCLTFDGDPLVKDLSGADHIVADNSNVSPIQGFASGAIALTAMSRLRFADSPDFDVLDLTLDLWMSGQSVPAVGVHGWLLDNLSQYGATYENDATVRCVIGSRQLVNGQITAPPGTWHHIACTYASVDRLMRVYVDGDLAGCATAPAPPTSGGDGPTIGATYSAAAGYSNNFNGGLDSIHLYARALAPDEICRAAGRTGCTATCPGTTL